MKPEGLISKLDSIAKLAFYEGLAIDSQVPSMRFVGKEIRIDSNRVSILNRGKWATYKSYCEAVQNRDFYLVLFDGGLIQVSFTIFNDTITKHRFAFIPCPLSVTPDEIAEYGIAELAAHRTRIFQS